MSTGPRITWASWQGDVVAVVTKDDLVRLLEIAGSPAGEDSNLAQNVAATADDVLETIISADGLDGTETRDFPARTAKGQAAIDADVTAWKQNLRRYRHVIDGILSLDAEE